MVFRKPYALLIKYFKLIHIIITSFMIYLCYKTVNLYKFFSSYVKSGWLSINSEEIAGYIGSLIYISIITIIILSVIVFLLMRFKNKPRMYYLLTPIIYFILLIIFAYTSSVLGVAEVDVVSPVTARIMRDILMICVGVQFVFIVFSLFRAIGFDIKKFNFKQDIADLQIAELDNEEVEVNFEVDKYKLSRKTKRRFRNMSYVFKEHKFIILTTLIMLIGGFLFYITLNRFVFSPIDKENNTIDLGNYNIIVNKSYVTTKNYKGETINKKYKYVLVSLSITNKIENSTFDLDKISLYTNNNTYYPVTNIYNNFIDMGNGYKDQILSINNTNNYYLVFKLPVEEKVNNVFLRYISGINYDKNNNPQNNYKKIKLSLINDENINIVTKSLKEQVTISSNEILINSFEINDKFNYTYKLCSTSDNCENKSYIVSTENNINNYQILKLNVTSTFGTKNNSSIKSITDFIANFGSITYIVDDKSYTQNNLTLLNTSTFNGNDIFISVSNKLKNATTINFDITIRNTKYRFKLK